MKLGRILLLLLGTWAPFILGGVISSLMTLHTFNALSGQEAVPTQVLADRMAAATIPVNAGLALSAILFLIVIVRVLGQRRRTFSSSDSSKLSP